MAAALQTSPGQQWSQLIALFSETKKIYASESPFLWPQKLGLNDQGTIHTLKKANIATFISRLFGGRDAVGFNHLIDGFLDIFIPKGTSFMKPHAQLLLELKTQAYISAVTSDKAAILNGERSRDEILDALFPLDLDKQLLRRRSGTSHLTSMERQLIESAQNRRQMLLLESQFEGAIDMLPQRFSWERFLGDFYIYIKGNIDNVAGNFVITPSMVL